MSGFGIEKEGQTTRISTTVEASDEEIIRTDSTKVRKLLKYLLMKVTQV